MLFLSFSFSGVFLFLIKKLHFCLEISRISLWLWLNILVNMGSNLYIFYGFRDFVILRFLNFKYIFILFFVFLLKNWDKVRLFSIFWIYYNMITVYLWIEAYIMSKKIFCLRKQCRYTMYNWNNNSTCWLFKVSNYFYWIWINVTVNNSNKCLIKFLKKFHLKIKIF